MGQGYSQPLAAGPGAMEGTDISDLVIEKSLGGARFFRTLRARHQHGIVVVKLCLKSNPSISFREYGKALREERNRLSKVPNVLAYQRIRETSTVGLVVRQYVHTSLYDRISIRPFLESVEKKWIAFQLLCALRDCQERKVFHGDIKAENVLVTSWGWVYLTDFASTFKPAYLPADNPADFSFYYDTSGRRSCYLAPERFLAEGQQAPGTDVQWNMDIFSLGCVLAELFTETTTFSLYQLYEYRKGEYDPTLSLLKIDDIHIRSLIGSMIRLNPEERCFAMDYLDEYKDKAFPLYFYQHLHVLMQDITDPTSGRGVVTASDANNGESDQRIDRIYDDFEMLSVSLGYEPPTRQDRAALPRPGLYPLQVDLPHDRHSATANLKPDSHNGTFILLNVITASLRSAGRASSKIRACELLLALAERLPDEAKLDRILPYVVPLLDDSNEMVLVAALRTMTQMLALVTVASPVNSFLFTQYIFPKLQGFVSTKGFRTNSIVRATYAASLASLAETASRFLDMMQALRADGSLRTDKGTDDDIDGMSALSADAYDATRLEILEQFESQTKVFTTDNDTAVRRAFLTSVPSLCVFFGEVRASDVLLSHLNTYLNDPDWQLKCAFLRTIVGVAVFLGGSRLEDFILPLMLQALTDPQEFVLEQALRSLASMAEMGMLQRSKIWELIDTVARFEMHPNMWVKEAASHFVSAATTYLSVADVRILVTPLVQPYLKVPVSSLSEPELLDALKKPISRAVLELALSWAAKVDRGLFWKSAQDSNQLSYRAVGHMPPTSSVADLGSRALGRIPKTDEDEQWLGRLRNAGLRSEDEMKLLAFREYLWRAAQRQKRDELSSAPTIYERIVSLTEHKVALQTVIFDNDVSVYEHRLQSQAEQTIADALEEDGGSPMDVPFIPLHLNGIDSPTAGPNEGGASSRLIDGHSRQFLGLRNQASESLSSSPSSAIGLLGKDTERGIRQRGSAAGVMPGIGSDLRSKASAAVATDDATAVGRLNTPVGDGQRAISTAPSAQRRSGPDHPTQRRMTHNYSGQDPTVLRLLDAVYVDNFPVDVAEFGPLKQSRKRTPIASNRTVPGQGSWHPQGQLVAVLAEHTAKVSRIIVAADHTFFLTASDDGSVKVWDSSRIERNVTHRAKQEYRLASGVRVTSLCFIENTHTFACTGSDGSIHVVKVEVTESTNSANTPRYGKLRVLRQSGIPDFGARDEHAVWSEHFRGEAKSTLVLATNLCRILAIDLRDMSTIFDLRNPAQHGTPTCFCISRRHEWILVGTSHGVLDLWDLRFRLRLRSWAFPSAAPITRLQLHPSKKTARRSRVCISGGTAGGEVTVWDIEKLICHEVYRPAHVGSKDKIHARDYELRNLDDERPEALLGRVAASVAEETKVLEQTIDAPQVATSLFFGLHQTLQDSETPHAFAITGGPDGKVRFWDSERLDGCCLVSGGAAGEKQPTYTLNQLGLDTRVLSEKTPEPDTPQAGGSSGRPPARRVGPGGSGTTRTTSKYDTIRLSARQLLSGHLDTITDVALLERPFGMVLSADRAGQVFIHQ